MLAYRTYKLSGIHYEIIILCFVLLIPTHIVMNINSLFTRIFLILTLLSTAISSKAQIAFESGINQAKLALTTNSVSVTNSFKTGATIGMLADIPFDWEHHLFFHLGAKYEMAGCKIKTKRTGEYFINTVDFPIHLLYKTGDKCGERFFVGAGPDLVRNLGGSYFLDAYNASRDTFVEFNVGRSIKDNLKKVGLAFGLNIGYMPKKHFYFQLRYLMGLSNLVPYGDKNNKIKSTTASFNMGYYISRCKQRKHSYSSGGIEPTHWRGLSKGVYSRRERLGRYPR